MKTNARSRHEALEQTARRVGEHKDLETEEDIREYEHSLNIVYVPRPQ